MLLEGLAGQRVLFVGGKGGVGKTSIASALARARAGTGVRVLVASTDPAHNLGHLWEREIGDTPVELVTLPGRGRVDGVEIDPQSTVDRHLAAVGETMRRLLPERMHAPARRHLALAREAPGTHESAVLERIAELVDTRAEDGYDLVIFDTAPTGHTLRLMALPDQLSSWTESLLANRDRAERFGAAIRGLGGHPDKTDRDAELRRILLRRRLRFTRLREVVTDSEQARFIIVLAAERLPVAETLELHTELDALGIEVGALIVNRRSPTDAGDLLAARHAQESRQVNVLTDRLGDIPMLEIPLLPGELVGDAALEGLAERL